MIISMTGFGLVEKNNSDFSIEINLRSVNNRFFDSNIRLPNSLLPLQKEIYDLLKSHCTRGTIHVNCKLKTNNKVDLLKIDTKKINEFYNLLMPINKKFSDSNFRLNLSFDGILNKLINDDLEFQLSTKNKKYIISAFKYALNDLLKSR